ncbi:hypothetical protein KEM09_02060 [Carboxylicivirga mesophila]|uniref:Uncharacterized protein n=1 Tax=Carboxylicivirga mesophila TaxID=1166478 RepID=A0ABS5K587_9BACT|nr:hypothetical protein [Carboxylicivirga mesophila]MBS2210164.1 hypothetical protein [Carboxylicivirga mesophila]
MNDKKDKEIEKLIAKKRLESEALKKILDAINAKREANAHKLTKSK